MTGAAFPEPSRPARIADAALAGPWRRRELADRLTGVAPVHTGGAEALASLLLDHFPRAPWGGPERLARELAALPGLTRTLTAAPPVPSVGRPPGVAPGRTWRWPVAPWSSVAEVAGAMDLRVEELEWPADPGGWLRRTSSTPLRHYRYRWWLTRGGGARLLEAPKPLLAERQRRVGRDVLAAIPLHDAAHGFVPGRSVTGFAAPHAGRPVVARFDLEGFFTSVTATRLRGLLTVAGYLPAIAGLVADLLTTATPADVLRTAPAPQTGEQVSARHRQRLALAAAHLAQGAPSSPAAANAVCFGLDRRLTALAEARGLRFTRYADDLAFSGPADTDTVALARIVGRIVDDEGFRLRPDKTRVMRGHQQQRLAGLVVNHRPAPPRRDYDRLRAVLHNCAVTGPEAQNHDGHPDFAAHLRGRIEWIGSGHPGRARTLLDLYGRIPWPT